MTHAVLPAVVVALLSFLLMVLGGDFVVADALYAMQGGTWAFQDTFFGESVIHIAGRNLSGLAWLLVLAAWVATFHRASWRQWRRPLGYLVLAWGAGVAAPALLKLVNSVECPWTLARYGGTREFLGFFTPRPESLVHRGCFPAGHSSSGYAWVALYFFFAAVRPAYRYRGLATGLGIGLIFGVSQQFRGAHFLSHDVWTVAICWFLSLGIYTWMFGAPGHSPSAIGAPTDGQ